MKKIVVLALCSLFIISAAEARTLYVNSKRPNNKCRKRIRGKAIDCGCYEY